MGWSLCSDRCSLCVLSCAMGILRSGKAGVRPRHDERSVKAQLTKANTVHLLHDDVDVFWAVVLAIKSVQIGF
jgi:hypothetical protein